MKISFQEILGFISIWSIMLPLLCGLILFKYLSKDSFIIWGVVVAVTIPQVISKLINDKSFISITYNLYTIVEFLFLFLFMFRKMTSNKSKIIIGSVSIFFPVLIIFFLVKLNLSSRFFNEWVCFTSIIYTLGVLLILFEQYISDNISITKKSPHFWFLSGILFYSPCTILVFSLWNFIKKAQSEVLYNIWIIHHLFNILLYVTFFIGMYIDYRNKHLSKLTNKQDA